MSIFSNNTEESSTVVNDFATVLERSFNPYEDKELRVPFYMTSSYRKRLKVRGVSMLVNPSSVSFRQNKRVVRKDTQGGSIFYHWANRMGRDNDILELDFSGQTGNINIRSGTIQNGAYGMFADDVGGRGPLEWLNNLASGTTMSNEDQPASVKLRGNDFTVSGAAKLANFWNLYSLTREPVVDPKTGSPVYYYVTYSSPAFGNTYVTFIGHFNRVLEFTDEAQKPFSKNYSFGFTVLSSIPSMDYLYNTITQNLRTVFTNPLG
jgi:hypothetical protein